jgi:hypothetical protein
MSERKCLNDGNPIPANRRSDALYCCEKCGWKYRNRMNRKANKDKNPHEQQLRINYTVVKKLVQKGIFDVSIEAMKLMGFDFEYCTGVGKVDPSIGTTEFQLFEYTITIENSRCKIKKRTL